jgi:hypothetical protein
MYERLKQIQDSKRNRVAVICVRYSYRGTIKQVTPDCLTLTDCYAVEEAGPAMADHVKAEDKIGGDLDISLAAIEIFFQPPWA